MTIHPLRGNLDTRLKKLKTEGLDAIILAAAGVRRLGLEDRITEYIPESMMLPAIGQGALSIEIRENDETIEKMTAPLEHRETRMAVDCERAFLARLEGGCQVPIAGQAKVTGDRVEMNGMVAEIDGSVLIHETIAGPVDRRVALGQELAQRLLERGGKEILDKVYGKAMQDLKP
jgi:hydroxymethylbilane synthase